MQKITLQPSILCIFSTSIRGGVSSRKFDAEKRAEGVRVEEEYRIVRVVEDVNERARAQAAVSRCRRRINAVTVDTVLGPLARLEDEAALDAAFRECDEEVAEFNATSHTCTLSAVGVKVEVAASNEQAALAIANQVRALVGDVQSAIAAADVAKIRQLASAAKGLDTLLPGDDGSALAEAIKAARSVASTIVREVEKKGRPIADVLAEVDTTPIEACAAHFLDFSSPAASNAAPAPAEDEDAGALAGALDVPAPAPRQLDIDNVLGPAPSVAELAAPHLALVSDVVHEPAPATAEVVQLHPEPAAPVENADVPEFLDEPIDDSEVVSPSEFGAADSGLVFEEETPKLAAAAAGDADAPGPLL